jgi:prepilin peptidase CpaA
MNLVPHSPTWLLALLFAALAAAAVEDFVRRRISNITCAAVLITALIAMGLQGFSVDLWQNAAVFLVLLGAGTLLFSAGKVGGGDVKLLACLGLWVNISAGVWLLVTSLLAGGLLAIAYIAARMMRGDRSKVSKGIPHGLAIVAGACVIFTGQMGLLGGGRAQPNAFSTGEFGPSR